MTIPTDLDAIARRIFPRLPHPMRPDEPWWTPGQMCTLPMKPLDFYGEEAEREYYCPTHHEGGLGNDAQHLVPPPDLMDWAVFGELLMWCQGQGVHVYIRSDGGVVLYPKTGKIIVIDDGAEAEADDPRHALALAIDAMLEGK